MKPLILVLLFIMFITIAACSSNQNGNGKSPVENSVSGRTNNEVVAKVGDRTITSDDIQYNLIRTDILFTIKGIQNNGPDTNTKETALTEFIRLIAIEELAKAKGITVTEEERNSRIEKLKTDLGALDIFNEKVADYGKNKFWEKETNRYSAIIQTEKLLNELIKKAQKENPNQVDKELQFNAKKDLEQLIFQQTKELEIQRFNEQNR